MCFAKPALLQGRAGFIIVLHLAKQEVILRSMTYILKEYDESLERILKEGSWKTNRTGVKTLSIFGMQSRYRIDEYFPLPTGRKIWHKPMFGELLTFISGKTRNQDFVENGCKFWTPWVDEEWAASKGYAPDAFGPVYGFNFRHFGGEYGNGTPNGNYGKDGFDQLSYMMDLLKNEPDSRRILFSYWNPKELDNMIEKLLSKRKD